MYQKQVQLAGLKTQSEGKLQPVINTLSSGVIQSIVASGQIQNISGRTIVLISGNDKAILNVPKSAQVFSYTGKNGIASGTPEAVNFSNLKIGNNITANLKLLSGGQIECNSIYIFPSALAK